MRYRTLATGALLLALISTPTHAQIVYKCVTKGRPTSFQSEPCHPAAKLVKAVAYTPDLVGSYRPDVNARPYASDRAKIAILPVARTPDLCAMARANRDYVLGANNQVSNYDVRVQLNDAVQRACN